MELAQVHQDQLGRLKACVEKSYEYDKHNYDRFNLFRKLVFDTSLDAETIALLKTLKKPVIEFNILEAYVSRLRGEFSEQEPSIEIMPGDEMPPDVNTAHVVQGHVKHIFDEANKDGFEYDIYTDTLSGGFSVGKLKTEYAHEMSCKQVMKVERVYDPCLCGFDPLARMSHKGDGNYAFELFPMLKTDFKREHPQIDIDKLGFSRAIEGFNWSYKNAKDEIVLIANFFEKKKKRVRIVETASGHTMTMDDYKKLIDSWPDLGFIHQPPSIVGKPRWTDLTTIVMYEFIENKVLKYQETDFTILPLVFFTGNSILIRDVSDKTVRNMCRPYVFNARGVQRLKNFAGQTLGNELENMIQHKFVVAKEALPTEEDFLQAYRDVQQADVLVYNSFNELFPDQQLPPPQPIQRIPIPPEVSNTFMSCDQTTQVILGNFDMNMGNMNKTQISGVAMVESITQSNSAAMPFVVGYLNGLGRLAKGIVDLLPKLVVTPRTLPILKMDGKRDYVKVNQPGGTSLQYSSNALNVKIEPGVNFAVQKARALNQIIALMQASPLFAQFMNTEGLSILLANIDIEGIDEIKMLAQEWMKQQKQIQQQQQKQMMNQPNPEQMKTQLEQAKIQQTEQDSQRDFQIRTQEVAIKKQQAATDHLKAIGELAKNTDEVAIAKDKARAEKVKAVADLAMDEADMTHRHIKESLELHHELTKEKDHGGKKENVD